MAEAFCHYTFFGDFWRKETVRDQISAALLTSTINTLKSFIIQNDTQWENIIMYKLKRKISKCFKQLDVFHFTKYLNIYLRSSYTIFFLYTLAWLSISKILVFLRNLGKKIFYTYRKKKKKTLRNPIGISGKNFLNYKFDIFTDIVRILFTFIFFKQIPIKYLLYVRYCSYPQCHGLLSLFYKRLTKPREI